MRLTHDDRIILATFVLVFSAFTTIYITQPVLPAVERHFNTSSFYSSLSVSIVLAGITLGSIPSGFLNEKYSILPLAALASVLIIICDIGCALTINLGTLISLRFCQGLFIPFLTSAMAASLTRSVADQNIVKGIAWYVTATILGGMTGRLIGGVTHYLATWQFAFLYSAAMLAVSCLIASALLPNRFSQKKVYSNIGSYRKIILEKKLWGSFVCAFVGQGIFSAVFNTLPYRLDSEPYNLSSNFISFIYGVYILSIFVAPMTGRLTIRYGSDRTLTGGAFVLFVSLLILTGDRMFDVIFGLSGICIGFFAIHTTAAARLNRRMIKDHGQANSLYMVFYYLGAFWGSSWSIVVFKAASWNSVLFIAAGLVLILFKVSSKPG